MRTEAIRFVEQFYRVLRDSDARRREIIGKMPHFERHNASIQSRIDKLKEE